VLAACTQTTESSGGCRMHILATHHLTWVVGAACEVVGLSIRFEGGDGPVQAEARIETPRNAAQSKERRREAP